jgi:hypothetical protein
MIALTSLAVFTRWAHRCAILLCELAPSETPPRAVSSASSATSWSFPALRPGNPRPRQPPAAPAPPLASTTVDSGSETDDGRRRAHSAASNGHGADRSTGNGNGGLAGRVHPGGQWTTAQPLPLSSMTASTTTMSSEDEEETGEPLAGANGRNGRVGYIQPAASVGRAQEVAQQPAARSASPSARRDGKRSEPRSKTKREAEGKKPASPGTSHHG